ncbi:MAG: beta-glucosidase BglX [Bacteroidota bacterium]
MPKLYPLLAYSIIIFMSVSCDFSKSPAVTIEDKVDSLLFLMTIEEKIGQTNLLSGNSEMTGPSPTGNSKQLIEKIKKGKVGGLLNLVGATATRKAQEMAVENSRLGIPLIFGYDILHGYQTMFPIPLAQAATWDADAAKLSSQVAATEAAAAGLHWTFAPMVDVSRDARWGRIMESPGEDPYLGAVMAKAWINGFQGEDLAAKNTLAATAKHFAAYGLAEAGREYNTVDISMQALHNNVLPPFKAANDAGVASFMNAFNEINGIPSTGNTYLQRELLKGTWNFQGFVVSDWASVAEMVTHGYAEDLSQAAEQAINAGSDMDMMGFAYNRFLREKIASGEVQEATLDDAVRRILRIKFMLGLFEDPYGYSNVEREKRTLMTAENLQKSREVAQKSIVLLKNEENLLPLSKGVQSVAVIGSLANSKDVPLGSWRAQAISNSAVSILEGIKSTVSAETTVRYAPGYRLTEGERSFVKELSIVEDDRSGFSEALAIAKQSELVIMVVGEDCWQTGEGRSQANISLHGHQNALIESLSEVHENIVAISMTGRPVPLLTVSDHSKALVQVWFGGSTAGLAIADVLFGDASPTGKLPVSFPYHGGQEPLYYSRKNTGRPSNNAKNVFWSHYTDVPNEAMFPFGHGLTYTRFIYSDLQLDVTSEGIQLSFQLSNVGQADGIETAQIYIRDVTASITRPILELKGFKRVSLKQGESQEVTYHLSKSDLSFYNELGQLTFEPGVFEVLVGTSSAETISDRITF